MQQLFASMPGQRLFKPINFFKLYIFVTGRNVVTCTLYTENGVGLKLEQFYDNLFHCIQLHRTSIDHKNNFGFSILRLHGMV